MLSKQRDGSSQHLKKERLLEVGGRRLERPRCAEHDTKENFKIQGILFQSRKERRLSYMYYQIARCSRGRTFLKYLFCERGRLVVEVVAEAARPDLPCLCGSKINTYQVLHILTLLSFFIEGHQSFEARFRVHNAMPHG